MPKAGRVPLPIVTKKSKGGELPSSSALDKAMLFPKSAEYFLERLTARLDSLGMSDNPLAKELVVAVKKYVDFVVGGQSAREAYWGGDTKIPTPFQSSQIQRLEEAAEALATKNVRLDFALTEGSELLIRAKIDGQNAGAEVDAAMNKLLDAWLTENDMLCEDDVIYEATPSGQILRDEAGKAQVVPPERISELISDPEKGIAHFAEKQDATTKITVNPIVPEAPTMEAQEEKDMGPSSRGMK